jgi:protein-S-isoprenylcysteine O-methyltransferase Ste14
VPIGGSVGRDIMTRKSITLRSRGFVDAVEKKGPIYRLITILPIPLVFLVALWSEPTQSSLCRGGIFVFLGELIRLWSAGYLSGFQVSLQDAELVTWGPYGLVRNPCAWGTFLLALGFAVMSAWWLAYLLPICVVVIGIFYVIPVEESLLREEFGEAYEAYCQTVPSYLPGWQDLLRWLRESRGVGKNTHRFRGREAWRAEGSTLMFLMGVIAAMIIQWLF